MSVRQTSIDCYHDLDLNHQQKMIMEVFEILGESCISDIAEYLSWERSTVSGRMNDLKKLGLLTFVGKRKSGATGIKSEFYRLKSFKETLF